MADIRKQLDTALGNKLSELRKSFDMSQSETANELNLTQASIGFYEKGIRLPSINVLESYAEYFKIDGSILYEKRIETIFNTVDLLGDNTPPHIKDEYMMIRYLRRE